MIMSLKQGEMQFKPRIKLNHKIYTYSAPALGKFIDWDNMKNIMTLVTTTVIYNVNCVFTNRIP